VNAKLKKVLLVIGISLFVLLACFGAGLYSGYKIAMDKYSTDLAKVGELYRESELANKRLTISNTELEWLNSESQKIIDQLSESLKSAGIGLGNIKDGNAEAKRLLSDLNSILQSVDTSQ
jgi:hypothetical protein